MTHGGEFSAFINEFGSAATEEEEDGAIGDSNAGVIAQGSKMNSAAGLTKEGETLELMKKATAGESLMQTEERNAGAVEWAVYKTYIRAGYGEVVMPLLLLSLVLLQGAFLLSS